MHPDWLVPQWPAPPGVQAVCTTRAGGQSCAPYDSLNLGDHVGDNSDDVAANRATLAQTLGAKPVFLSQVHGTQVQWLGPDAAHGTPSDACMTGQRGLVCTIMVADCLPVLFTNASGSHVAAAHAGWRGLTGADGAGVLDAVLDHFKAAASVGKGFDASEIIAWLGPCIGPDAFEVGEEVRAAFVAQDPAASHLFRPVGPNGTAVPKWLADLPGLARLRLVALGVHRIYGNDGTSSWCTVSNPSRFFSHRRDRVSGRLAACIWRS
jgi:YfiH family protein